MSTGIIASQAFVPNKLAELKLWLDGLDLGTLTEVGGFLSNWGDKSGEGNDISQLTGVKQPTTGIDTINGKNAITFDGVDDFLQRTSFTGGALSQPNTVFIVWELPVLPSAVKKIIDGGVASNRHVVEMTSANVWSMFAGASKSGGFRPINTPYVTESIFDGVSSEGYVNGTLDISGNTGTEPLNGITIGARFTEASFLNVKIGEIIIYGRALPTLERLLVQSYLFNKWRITLPFPLVFSQDFSSDFA